MDPADELLTPSQVAQLFGVNPKTVTRWADTGRLDYIRTPGGHRRFRRTEITALLADNRHTIKGDVPGYRPSGGSARGIDLENRGPDSVSQESTRGVRPRGTADD